MAINIQNRLRTTYNPTICDPLPSPLRANFANVAMLDDSRWLKRALVWKAGGGRVGWYCDLSALLGSTLRILHSILQYIEWLDSPLCSIFVEQVDTFCACALKGPANIGVQVWLDYRPCCDQIFVLRKHWQRASLSNVAGILARNTGRIPAKNGPPTALTSNTYHPRRSSKRCRGAPSTWMDTPSWAQFTQGIHANPDTDSEKNTKNSRLATASNHPPSQCYYIEVHTPIPPGSLTLLKSCQKKSQCGPFFKPSLHHHRFQNPSNLLNFFLLRGFRLHLALFARACRCRRPFHTLGGHRAACAQSTVASTS